MCTLCKGKFLTKNALLNLKHLLLMSLGVVQYNSVALLHCLPLKLYKFKIDFEQLSLVVRGDNHTAFFLAGDGDGY
jgi:hypothetical protein